MKEVLDTMPKTADATLKTQPEQSYEVKRQTKGGTYHSQIDAIKKYEEKNKDLMEQVKVRLPKGTQELLQNYVAEKAEEFPEDPRYSTYTGRYWRPSVNALIKALLEEELGRSLD